MLISISDHHTCKLISPSVVLDRGLDGEDLGWVRDHLRFCEACRRRVELFRKQRLANERAAASFSEGPASRLTQSPESTLGALVAKASRLPVRRQTSRSRVRSPQKRRYAIAGILAVVVGVLFVSSSPRFAADAVRPSPISSTLFEIIHPIPEASPSAAPSASPEPSTLPATSQEGASQTAIAPSTRPTPAPTRVPTPAPVAAAPPAVHLTVTPLSGLAPLAVTTDASGSTDASGIVSYIYDFGDGTAPAFGATTTHTYRCPGLYKLSVTVTNSLGLRSPAYLSVYVYPPQPPVSC